MLSLDATVVLLTPVVVATAQRMRVPIAPHGYMVGHLANSASLLLPVSNLTNLHAAACAGRRRCWSWRCSGTGWRTC